MSFDEFFPGRKKYIFIFFDIQTNETEILLTLTRVWDNKNCLSKRLLGGILEAKILI